MKKCIVHLDKTEKKTTDWNMNMYHVAQAGSQCSDYCVTQFYLSAARLFCSAFFAVPT